MGSHGQTSNQAIAEALCVEAEPCRFEELYEQYFDFVWRWLRNEKVHEASLRDAAQDVWLVVHRRLPEFEGRAPIRSWLYGVTVRVASTYRRTKRRREDPTEATDFETLSATHELCPQKAVEHKQSMALVDALLLQLDADKREVFVLSELNELTVPEISALLSVNINTVYSRLQAGRRQFDSALARHWAKAERGQRV